MSRPWKVSRGPIAATEFDIHKAGAINKLLARPIGVLPIEPGEPIKPFANGLFEDIRGLLKPEVAVKELRRAIGIFAHSKRYWLACAQPDSMRHDIRGAPVEPLSAADRLTAQEHFLELIRRNRQIPQNRPKLQAFRHPGS